MKLKFKFEPSDFHNMGQMIICESCPRGCCDIGFMSTVSYKIGWKVPQQGPNIAMRISLCDGLCIEYPTVEKLCESLNADKQGFRPMSIDEIIAVMTFNGNRFLGCS